ncbi:hypothetical protein L7F22_026472 [Adiantum nelumboides]|nr:hypothetical protein [Adiantum nelumboides]
MALELTRALSGAEENWLRGTAGGSGICVFGALFIRAIDTQHVSAAAQELLECHPILRVLIVENTKGKACFQASATCSAAHDYVENRPWPSVDEACTDGIMIFGEDHHDKHGSLALHTLVREELNVNFLNSEGKPSPPLRVFSVLVYHSSSRQQTAILVKVHGAVLDQKSVNIVIQEFLVRLDRTVEGRPHQSLSVKSEEGLPAPFEELIPKSKASKGFLQKGLDALGYAISSKKHSLLPFQPSFNLGSVTGNGAFQTNFLSVPLGKQGTAILFDTCKKENVSCAAALSAALLKTVAAIKELKEKGQNEFCLTIIMDCRPFLEPKLAETTLGNYISGIPEGVKVQPGVDVWDLARQIYATIEKDLSKSKQFSEFSVLSMLYSQVGHKIHKVCSNA